MTGLLRVRRGMPVRRAVATADLAAFEADPQVEPGIAGLEAFLAAVDRLGQLGHVDVVEVGAGGHESRMPEPAYGRGGSVRSAQSSKAS